MARKSAKPLSAIKRILAIDIGGTGLKVGVLDLKGKFLADSVRVKTPRHPTPKNLVAALTKLAVPFAPYDCVSIGFPGYVRGGKVYTAPHLGTETWAGFALEAAMAKALGKPVRLLNDADVQGLAVIKGKGLEIVCTLGTGFGTSVFHDGALLPHMDLAHMVVHPRDDFDTYIGDQTYKQIGRKAWSKRLKKVMAMLEQVFFYDHLYLGGGNSRHVKFKLPANVSIVSNDAGISGGAFIWLPKSGCKQGT